MKEHILLPKHMYDSMTKNVSKKSPINKSPNVESTLHWQTHVPPPIPLNQTGIISYGNTSTDKKLAVTPTIIDKLPIYFTKNDQLKRARLILPYFKNNINNEGDIISPSNVDKNVIDVIKDMLNISKLLKVEDLQFYHVMINTLNIPLDFIKNRMIRNLFSNTRIKLPIGGGRNKLKNKKYVKRTNTCKKVKKQAHIKWSIF